MLKVRNLLDYTNLLSPNDYEKNDKLTFSTIFNNILNCAICGRYRNFEKPKISYPLEKTLVISIICSKWKNEELL